MRVSFKIYADFDCCLKKTKGLSEGKVADKSSSRNVKYQNHVPCVFGYKVVCVDD